MTKTVVLTALSLAIAACWSETPKPEPKKPQPTAKPTPCPDAPVLHELAIAAWGSGVNLERRPELEVMCIPLHRDGKTYWWLEGPAGFHEYSSYVTTGYALIDELRAVVWEVRLESDSFGYIQGGGQAADIDGDGNDEVVYERMTGEGGMMRNELIVVGFTPTPAPVQIILGLSGDGGERACRGSWSLQPHGRGKLIDVTWDGNWCDSFPSHERFDAQGQALRTP
jgi:hypothetical protein